MQMRGCRKCKLEKQLVRVSISADSSLHGSLVMFTRLCGDG